jgi:small subunit ribosomal protein S8e
VRTQTLVKNAIIQVDATPFKTWYQTHYGVELGGKGKEEAPKIDDKKVRAAGARHRKCSRGRAGQQLHVGILAEESHADAAQLGFAG